MKNILVLSATASAINYKNSLADDRNYRLFLTDASKFAAGLYDERITPLLIPLARAREKYKNMLDDIIEKYAIDILIPTSDHDMEAVASLLQQGWLPKAAMFRFDTEKFFLYTHKRDLAEKMQSLGFDSMRLFKEDDKITFPVVVKPTREGGSKGVWIVNDEKDFKEKLALVKSQFGTDIVIQEYIPGGTGSIFVVLLLYNNEGELRGEVVTQSSLTFMTWGGGGNAGDIVDRPDLLEYAKRILQSLGGWKGPINMEFKQHQGSGKYYLMEINCRLNGYSYLNTMNGLNFPKGVVELLEKGETAFISPKNIRQKKNFVINYREKLVEQWVS